MNRIKSSVGEGGRNDRQDVGTVQYLLNVVRRRYRAEPLAVDGIVGPKTLAAIREFQQGYSLVVDGRVDPGKATITLLTQLAPQRKANTGVAYLTHRPSGNFA
jgi:peptidoglycan hydrolase-like protein with peptidoglycan-binding domain